MIKNRTPVSDLSGDVTLDEGGTQVGSNKNESGIATTNITGLRIATSAGSPTTSTAYTNLGDTVPVIAFSIYYDYDQTGAQTVNLRLTRGGGGTELVTETFTPSNNNAAGHTFVYVDTGAGLGGQLYNLVAWITGGSQGVLVYTGLKVTGVKFTDTQIAEARKLNGIIRG